MNTQELRCRWVVKCDDDVYADPHALMAALDALPQVCMDEWMCGVCT